MLTACSGNTVHYSSPAVPLTRGWHPVAQLFNKSSATVQSYLTTCRSKPAVAATLQSDPAPIMEELQVEPGSKQHLIVLVNGYAWSVWRVCMLSMLSLVTGASMLVSMEVHGNSLEWWAVFMVVEYCRVEHTGCYLQLL